MTQFVKSIAVPACSLQVIKCNWRQRSFFASCSCLSKLWNPPLGHFL